MLDLVFNLSIFIFIIFLGIFVKSIGLFSRDDASLIGKMILYITLPAALLSNADRIVLNTDTLYLIAIGLMANLSMLGLGWLFAWKKDPVTRAGLMLNTGTYNIGNFSLPFVSLLYKGQGVAYLCMFDTGNAIIGLGLAYVIAQIVAFPQKKVTLSYSIKKLFSSVPFDTYLLLLVLAALNITLPEGILDIARTIGNANTFLAMFMVGLLFEFRLPKSERKEALQVVALRTAGNLLLALLAYAFLPLPLLAKKIVAIALLSPVASVVPIYSSMVGYTRPLSAVTSTITAMESIVFFVLISFFL